MVTGLAPNHTDYFIGGGPPRWVLATDDLSSVEYAPAVGGRPAVPNAEGSVL